MTRPQRLTALGVLILIAGAGYGVYHWSQIPKPAEPPVVDLDGVDPDVAEAVTKARSAVAESPNSGPAWGELGMVLAAHDYKSEARAAFAEAERLDPEEVRWPYFHALILLDDGPEAALPALERAASRADDRTTSPRLLYAETLFGVGKTDAADAQFRAVLSADPSNARAALGAARVEARQGETAEALARLEAIPVGPMNRKAVHTLRAQLFRRVGKAEEAASELAVAARLPEDTAWPDPLASEVGRRKRGVRGDLARVPELVSQGRIEDAVGLLERRVRRSPEEPWVWQWLGRLYLQRGEARKAAAVLGEAVRLDPDSSESRHLYGATLFELGEFRQAEIHYRQATVLKPDFSPAHLDLGNCLSKLGDRAGAVAAFRDAVRADENSAAAHRRLGQALIEIGEREEGAEHLRYADELSPAGG